MGLDPEMMAFGSLITACHGNGEKPTHDNKQDAATRDSGQSVQVDPQP
jgi:hypothetical protein